jgi:hypothetical protein
MSTTESGGPGAGASLRLGGDAEPAREPIGDERMKLGHGGT